MTYTSEYPIAYLAVDLCIFTIRPTGLSILLVERAEEPLGWALPGGFVQPDEDAETAAARELMEETGVSVGQGHLEQLRTYSHPLRDTRYLNVGGRVVSAAFVAFAPDMPEPKAGSDARNTRWWNVSEVLSGDGPTLAFDHAQIVADAVERVRSKLEYTPLGTQFVKEPFTIPELHRVYTEVWGFEPDRRNFQRKLLKSGVVEATEERGDPDQRGPRPRLYVRGSATIMHPALMRSEPVGEDE